MGWYISSTVCFAFTFPHSAVKEKETNFSIFHNHHNESCPEMILLKGCGNYVWWPRSMSDHVHAMFITKCTAKLNPIPSGVGGKEISLDQFLTAQSSQVAGGWPAAKLFNLDLHCIAHAFSLTLISDDSSSVTIWRELFQKRQYAWGIDPKWNMNPRSY